MNQPDAEISIECLWRSKCESLCWGFIPNGEDAKIINPSEEPAQLVEVVHLGRRKGGETVLEVVGPGP